MSNKIALKPEVVKEADVAVEGTASLIEKEVQEESKSSYAEYELPLGFLNPEGKLYDSVLVREMTGEEEDVFASRKMSVSKKINIVISNCTMELISKEIPNPIKDKKYLEEIVAGLPSIDRMFLLVRIRQQTYGDLFKFEYECQNTIEDKDGERKCGSKQLVSVNLADLDVKIPADKRKRTFDLVLSNGKKLEFRIMTGLDDYALSGNADITISDMMLRRVLRIGDKPASLDDLKKMSMKDRKKLRDEMSKADSAGMDNEIEIECKDCKKIVKETLRYDSADFFFPEGQ